MSPKPTKVLFIGIDQAIPYLLKKFMEENVLPNISKLVDGGVIGEGLSCPPCDTPTNWATLATGATTAVHGATSFYLHLPGEPFELGPKIRSRTSLSRYAGAEFIWDTAEKNGKVPFVINYPGGWPSNFKKGAMSLLTWPLPESLPRELSYPAKLKFSSEPSKPSLKISKAGDDLKKFDTKSPLLHITIGVKNRHVEQAPSLKGYIIDSAGNGYDSLAIFNGTEEEWQILKLEEWSDWISVDVESSHGKLPCLFKAQIKEMASDGSRLNLQLSSYYNTKGWTNPEDFGEKLVRNAIVHEFGQEEKVDYMITGKVKKYLFRARSEALTLARAIKYAKDSLGWDLCYFHIHLLDAVNHRTLAVLHEGSPFYTEKAARKALGYVQTAYQIVDELVGILMESCVDEDTVVFFLSDHGAIPTWRMVNVPLALVRANLLNYKWDDKKKKLIVDWKKTVAFPYLEPPYIWVNLKGRDPQGIVNAEEYESVRDRIIQALYQMKDPETGAPIIKLAIRKEEAADLGQDGERIGDIVYFLNPPFTLFDGALEQLDPSEQTPEILVKPEAYNVEVNYAAHAYYLPDAKLGEYSVSVPIIVNGPGIKNGFKLEKPVNLIDIAPTIAHILQIPAPKNSEGTVLNEILE